MKISKLIKEGIIFFLFLLLLSLFSIVLVTGFLILRREKHGDLKIYEYKYYRLNTLTNESSFGFVSDFQYLKSDDYISYQDLDDSFILVSNLNSKEYKCTGKCICESGGKRRSTISIGRGITYLVAAVTSIIAHQKAKEYFENDCENQFLTTSSLEDDLFICNSVRSEIDSCEQSIDKNNIDQDDDVESKNSRRYLCHGNCLPSKNLVIQEEIIKAQYFGCEDLTKKGEVEIEYYAEEKENEFLLSKSASKKFLETQLEQFCEEKSKEQYLIELPSGRKKLMNTVLCVGNYLGYNDSIKCRIIE